MYLEATNNICYNVSNFSKGTLGLYLEKLCILRWFCIITFYS